MELVGAVEILRTSAPNNLKYLLTPVNAYIGDTAKLIDACQNAFSTAYSIFLNCLYLSIICQLEIYIAQLQIVNFMKR